MTPAERAHARQIARAYYEKNRERCLAQCKAAQTRRWTDDPETARAKARTYYQKNRRYISARDRLRRLQRAAMKILTGS